MKILIVGGLGFVGSHLINLCLRKNHEIFVIDLKKDNSLGDTNKNIKIFNCDITKSEELKKIKLNNLDLVLHCAAQPSVAMSFEKPVADLEVNVLGTFNLLRWCGLNNVKRIIYASTFNVYKEDSSINTYNETSICEPRSLLGISKLTAENYIRVYGNFLGIKWNIFRMFNIYGPGQDQNNKFLGMISIFLNMAKKDPTIIVKGSLNRFRDFIFIEDVIKAWGLLIDDKKNYDKIYNLGSGTKCFISDLLKEISLTLNKKLNIKEIPGSSGDFMGSVSDISRIKNDLGFKPDYNLKTGLKLFNNWLESKK